MHRDWPIVMAAWALATQTGGGAHIGGDVDARGDVSGRDRVDAGGVTFNNYGPGDNDSEPRRPQSIEKMMQRVLLMIDGDPEYGVVGIRNHIRVLRFQVRIVMITLIGVVIVVFAQLIVILILLRRLA